MATIVIDNLDEQDDNPVIQPAATPEPSQQQQTQTPSPAPAENDDDIPEKFRGKKLAEVVRAYEELERHSGRLGAEVGELRKTHDEIIRASLPKLVGDKKPNQASQETAADDDTEFFVNPRQAIAKAVEQHPLVRDLRNAQTLQQKDKALNELASRHADWREVMSTPEFASFVQSSPIHARLIEQADRNYDVEAADYVLSQFKATRQQPQPAPAPAAAVTEDLRRAAVSAGRVPAGAAAPGGDASKPIYKRSVLIKKMQTDPDWYAANADDILAAYAEGRVR